MNKAILILIGLVIAAGCVKQESTAPKGDVKSATQEAVQGEPMKAAADLKSSAETVGRDVVATVQETAAKVAAAPEEVSRAMQATVKSVAGLVKTTKEAEEIIAENSWGFSAYEPNSGIEEFYTSSGVLLGTKKRQ